MSLLVLALLVGLWSAILLPGAIRARRAASPHNSVEAFREAMERLSARASQEAGAHAPSPDTTGGAAERDVLGSAQAGDGGTCLDPAARRETAAQRARRRRSVVAATLLMAMALGAAGAVAVHAAFVWLLAVSAAAAAGYAGLLVGLRWRAEEARRKVTPLPARPQSPPPPASGDAAALSPAAGEESHLG